MVTDDRLRQPNPNSPEVVLNSVASVVVSDKILASKYFSKQRVWLDKLMDQQKKLFGVAAVVEPAALQEYVHMLGNDLGFGGGIVRKLKYSDASLDCVYDPVFYKHRPGQNLISLTNYACTEARLLLTGSEIVIAWRYKELEGDSFAQKLKNLNRLSAEAAVSLASRIGFVLTYEHKGTVVVLPAGHMVATLTPSTETEVLRWSFNVSSPTALKAEVALAREALTDLLAAYPSFRKGAHQKFQQILELHMGS